MKRYPVNLKKWIPLILCLKDVTRRNRPISSRGFQIQACYKNFDSGSHVWVAVMVHQDNPFQAIHLKITLQVKAMKTAMTPLPSHSLNIDNLEDLLRQLLIHFYSRKISIASNISGDTPWIRALESLFSGVYAVLLNIDTPDFIW